MLEVPLPGASPSLEGLRIAHLSDFHLGVPGRGRAATLAAVAWVEERRPDLVCVTGDLVSRPGAQPLLRELLDRLARVAPAFCVLGNHDLAETRDPFSRPAEVVDTGAARLLADEAVAVDVRGARIQLVGVDPRSYARRASEPARLADHRADLRVLLCHYPRVMRRLPEGAFDLVLAGHLHAGQIVLPYPGGKLPLAHPGAKQIEGLHAHSGGLLHVSPGLGTTFVPFRFLARPEATELVVRSR